MRGRVSVHLGNRRFCDRQECWIKIGGWDLDCGGCSVGLADSAAACAAVRDRAVFGFDRKLTRAFVPICACHLHDDWLQVRASSADGAYVDSGEVKRASTVSRRTSHRFAPTIQKLFELHQTHTVRVRQIAGSPRRPHSQEIQCLGT